MNREIKFRAKFLSGNKHIPHPNEGKWVYGDLVHDAILHCDGFTDAIYQDGEAIPVDKESIGQFIGLRDKNGKEIYEGDIISISNVGGDYVVRYDLMNCCYALFSLHAEFVMGRNFADFLKEAQKDRYEVIGNIFDRRTKNE